MNVAHLKGPVHAPVPNLVLYTEDCNMRCTYCFVEKKRRMTLETARRAWTSSCTREISGTRDTVNITFFGGEPFLGSTSWRRSSTTLAGVARTAGRP